MSQLMGKDILYEPLKELHDKVRVFVHVVVTPPHTNFPHTFSSLRI